MHDLIIIGGGPAALSAAVYALGKQLDILVIYEQLGGKAGTQQLLHGQSDACATPGAEVAHLLQREIAAQLERTVCDRVISLSTIDTGFQIATQEHGTYQSRAAIVATGTTPRMLDLPGARELLGQGLGYSVTTHAHLVAGKQVAVIGTTTRALRGAAELARTAARVYLVAPDAAGLDTPMAHKLQQRPNIEALAGYHIKAVNGLFNVESLIVERGDEHRWLRVDAAFVDLGLVPNSRIVRQLVQIDLAGFICVDERNATSLAGLFAAGDVTTGFGEQIFIAIGDGARAALSAYDYLLAQGPVSVTG